MRFYDARFDQAKGEDEQKQDERDDAHLLGLSLAPEAHHDHRQHFISRTVEQDRGGELAQDDEEQKDPADGEGGPGEREKDPPKRGPEGSTVAPRALLEIGRDPGERPRHGPNRERERERDVGDEKGPPCPVERNGSGEKSVGPEEAHGEDHARHHPGKPGENLDDAPNRESGAHHDVGDERAEEHRGRGPGESEEKRVRERSKEETAFPDVAVVLESEHIPPIEAEELEERSEGELTVGKRNGHPDERQDG